MPFSEEPARPLRRRLRPDARALVRAQSLARQEADFSLERLVEARRGEPCPEGFVPKTEYTVDDVRAMVEIGGLRLQQVEEVVAEEERRAIRLKVPVTHEGETIAYVGQGWSRLFWMSREAYRAGLEREVARRNQMIAGSPSRRGR